MDIEKTGQLIAQQRKMKNWTQKQLADAVGVTDKAISRWETGRGFPDAVYLQPLAQALEISITELVNGELTRPEIAAKQADDALLATLEYGKKMRRTVVSTLLAIAGGALAVSGFFVTGENAGFLPILGCFLLAMAAGLKFWKNGPSPALAQYLAGGSMLLAVVLQALPVSAALVFKGPDYYNRNLYSCFDPMLWGYADFGPGLSAILSAIVLVLIALRLLGRRERMGNGIFVSIIVAAVMMAVPWLLMGAEYVTPVGFGVVLLQITAAFFQARVNAN